MVYVYSSSLLCRCYLGPHLAYLQYHTVDPTLIPSISLSVAPTQRIYSLFRMLSLLIYRL